MLLRPFVVRSLVAATFGLLALVPPSVFAQAPVKPAAPTATTAAGFLIRYADGRMHTRRFRNGGYFTAGVPFIKGADTSRNGLPFNSFEILHVVEGTEALVQVNLHYGLRRTESVKVAAFRLKPGAPVEVKELTAFGIEPITISIVAIASSPAPAPETVSPSAQLDVSAEPISASPPTYRIVLTNRSDVPVAWFYYRGYSNGRPATSAPRGKRGQPIVPARGQYTFEFAMTASGFITGEAAQAWSPLDRFEIVSMLWADGVVEGDRNEAERRGRMDERRIADLQTFVRVLTDTRNHSPAILRARVAALMTADSETEGSRNAAIADLEALDKSGRTQGGEEFAAWVSRVAAEHEQWISRIVLPRIYR